LSQAQVTQAQQNALDLAFLSPEEKAALAAQKQQLL
jgi:adenosine deaminase